MRPVVLGCAFLILASGSFPACSRNPPSSGAAPPPAALAAPIATSEVTSAKLQLATAVESDLDLQLGDQSAHARLGHLRSFLLDQPLPHPSGGVALLAWRVQIGDQPAADRGLVRPQRR